MGCTPSLAKRTDYKTTSRVPSVSEMSLILIPGTEAFSRVIVYFQISLKSTSHGPDSGKRARTKKYCLLASDSKHVSKTISYA